jgi:hypothetical protein
MVVDALSPIYWIVAVLALAGALVTLAMREIPLADRNPDPRPAE